ncbi:MAG TPA: SDR family oxidoreductase [Xenococcaceae cyanobacterium]
MKITIIGCGYVGSAIARFWHQAGHDLTVTTTTPEKVAQLASLAKEVAVVNSKDLKALQQVMQNRDVVLLCVGAKNRDNYQEAYLETAKNVVQVLKSNSSVKQLIYTGSYAVLGDKNGAWTDETAAVAPANQNGEILCQTEEVLLSAISAKLKVCLLRLAGIYGAGRELIKIFRPWSGTTRPGTGEDYSNWIHLADIVGGIEVARTKELMGIYHLACDEPLQTRDFLQRLFTTHNLPGVTWDRSLPSVRPYNTRLSNAKIKAAGLELVYPQIIF